MRTVIQRCVWPRSSAEPLWIGASPPVFTASRASGTALALSPVQQRVTRGDTWRHTADRSNNWSSSAMAWLATTVWSNWSSRGLWTPSRSTCSVPSASGRMTGSTCPSTSVAVMPNPSPWGRLSCMPGKAYSCIWTAPCWSWIHRRGKWSRRRGVSVMTSWCWPPVHGPSCRRSAAPPALHSWCTAPWTIWMPSALRPRRPVAVWW